VVVAWRRGSLRAVLLAGLLAAVAMVGAIGALWLFAGDGAGDDAAAPIDDRATPDRRDVDSGATGPHGTVPAAPLELPGSLGPGAAEAAGTWSARDRAPGPGAGTDESSVRLRWTTRGGPNRGGAPGPSIPATTVPAPSVPPGGITTTTTGPGAPPADDSSAAGAGGLGGLLGRVLDVLGVG
jgi:hypothetical protein